MCVIRILNVVVKRLTFKVGPVFVRRSRCNSADKPTSRPSTRQHFSPATAASCDRYGHRPVADIHLDPTRSQRRTGAIGSWTVERNNFEELGSWGVATGGIWVYIPPHRPVARNVVWRGFEN